MAANTTVNSYVLGAWIRLCQLSGNNKTITTRFDKKYTDNLIDEIKNIMCQKDTNNRGI